jgi:hypothetical protein
MLVPGEFLDPVLVQRIGDIDEAAHNAIAKICEEALISVAGPELSEDIAADRKVMRCLVPWLWDLACGLHYQHIFGPAAPATEELVARLTSASLSIDQRDLLIDRIDWTYILTENRVAEFVQGRGAINRNPAARDYTYPWYGRLKVGYHIRITIEALRLL